MSARSVAREILGRTLLRRNLILPFVRERRYVFVYHDVSEPDSPHHWPVYSTPFRTFVHQVAFLRSLFRLVPLAEIVAPSSGRDRGHLAAIVFDDGFRSVLDRAHPHLASLGIPFAVFVNRSAIERNALWCTDVVLGRADLPYMSRLLREYIEAGAVDLEAFLVDPLGHLIASPRLTDDYTAFSREPRAGAPLYMSADEIRFLHSKGVTVGSHTVSHKVLARCSDEALAGEVIGNAHYLAGLLGEEIQHLALPFGFEGTFDRRVLGLARSTHRYVYSSRRAFFTGIEARRWGFVVPRIGLRSESPEEIMVSINLPFFTRRGPRFPDA